MHRSTGHVESSHDHHHHRRATVHYLSKSCDAGVEMKCVETSMCFTVIHEFSWNTVKINTSE